MHMYVKSGVYKVSDSTPSALMGLHPLQMAVLYPLMEVCTIHSFVNGCFGSGLSPLVEQGH